MGLVVALFIYRVWDPAVPTDKESLCPVSGAKSVTVILIDQTDAFSTIQRGDIRSQLVDVRDEVEQHGAITIYLVGDPNEQTLMPVFTICNPGTEEEINKFKESVIQARKRWHNRFAARLDRELDTTLAPHSADFSPILESVQSISITEFSGRSNNRRKKRLIIISDFLQRSRMHSQYKSIVGFDRFRRTDNFQKLKADLRDVSVEMLYLRRTTANSVQGSDHKRFWKQYFESQGASVTRIYEVSG